MRKPRDRERRLLSTWLDHVSELRRPGPTAEPSEAESTSAEEALPADTEEAGIGGWARETST